MCIRVRQRVARVHLQQLILVHFLKTDRMAPFCNFYYGTTLVYTCIAAQKSESGRGADVSVIRGLFVGKCVTSATTSAAQAATVHRRPDFQKSLHVGAFYFPPAIIFLPLPLIPSSSLFFLHFPFPPLSLLSTFPCLRPFP